MGVCLVELKQYHEACRVFERGLKFHPENDQMAKELKKVKDHLKSLPKNAQAAKSLGNELFKEGKYEEALGLYKVGEGSFSASKRDRQTDRTCVTDWELISNMSSYTHTPLYRICLSNANAESVLFLDICVCVFPLPICTGY